MNSKVKPSQVLSKTIENLLNGQQPTEELLTDLLRLGAERILQETGPSIACGQRWSRRAEKSDCPLFPAG